MIGLTFIASPKNWCLEIYSVLKTVDLVSLRPRAIALGRQPLLHFMPLRRTTAYIAGRFAGDGAKSISFSTTATSRDARAGFRFRSWENLFLLMYFSVLLFAFFNSKFSASAR